MANGRIVYGSTTYDFAINYEWEYPAKTVAHREIDYSTTGEPKITHLYTLNEFALTFLAVSDTQKAALDAAGVYPGKVTFLPDGVGGASYSGVWSVVESIHIGENQHNMTCQFVGKSS